jgi:hypothetical protein
VVSVQWFGSQALELTYKGLSGRVANELLYRHDEFAPQPVGLDGFLAHAVWGGGGDSGSIRACA